MVTIQKQFETKKRVAVLSKKFLADRPYDKWLGEAGCEVVLFASKDDNAACLATSMQEKGSYKQIFLFRNWKDNPEVDCAVLSEHAKNPLNRIVAIFFPRIASVV